MEGLFICLYLPLSGSPKYISHIYAFPRTAVVERLYGTCVFYDSFVKLYEKTASKLQKFFFANLQ